MVYSTIPSSARAANEAAGRCCPVPSHELEPVEAVVEGVTACHGALGLLLGAGGHFPRPVVHLTHQLQPLPAREKAGITNLRECE